MPIFLIAVPPTLLAGKLKCRGARTSYRETRNSLLSNNKCEQMHTLSGNCLSLSCNRYLKTRPGDSTYRDNRVRLYAKEEESTRAISSLLVASTIVAPSTSRSSNDVSSHRAKSARYRFIRALEETSFRGVPDWIGTTRGTDERKPPSRRNRRGSAPRGSVYAISMRSEYQFACETFSR